MQQLTGRPVSPGYAEGTAFVYDPQVEADVPRYTIGDTQVAAEHLRFREAVQLTNNDADENPFNFTLTGRVVTSGSQLARFVSAAASGPLFSNAVSTTLPVAARTLNSVVAVNLPARNVDTLFSSDVSAFARTSPGILDGLVRSRASEELEQIVQSIVFDVAAFWHSRNVI